MGRTITQNRSLPVTLAGMDGSISRTYNGRGVGSNDRIAPSGSPTADKRNIRDIAARGLRDQGISSQSRHTQFILN